MIPAPFYEGCWTRARRPTATPSARFSAASAVPPTLECCDKPPGVDSHYESFLQYFIELLRFYIEVLGENGYSDVPIIVTQMGWGTSEGNNTAVPSSGFEWLTYTSEDEQALYVSQAFQIVQKMEKCLGRDFVQPEWLRSRG